MTKANALLIVPEEVEELPAESEVKALLLDDSRTLTAEPPV
jgi:molybdopterin biosynthesis enzyme